MAQAHTILTDSSAKAQKRVWGEDVNDFMLALDTYRSTVPEAAVRHVLEKGGVTIKDPRIVKIAALAADKFLAEIVFEAKQMSQLRSGEGSQGSKRKTTEDNHFLDMVDLERSLAPRRIFLRMKTADKS